MAKRQQEPPRLWKAAADAYVTHGGRIVAEKEHTPAGWPAYCCMNRSPINGSSRILDAAFAALRLCAPPLWRSKASTPPRATGLATYPTHAGRPRRHQRQPCNARKGGALLGGYNTNGRSTPRPAATTCITPTWKLCAFPNVVFITRRSIYS